MRKFWKMDFQQNTICGKTIKIVVSAENAQNQKWYLFFQKGVFWDGWESGFH